METRSQLNIGLENLLQRIYISNPRKTVDLIKFFWAESSLTYHDVERHLTAGELSDEAYCAAIYLVNDLSFLDPVRVKQVITWLCESQEGERVSPVINFVRLVDELLQKNLPMELPIALKFLAAFYLNIPHAQLSSEDMRHVILAANMSNGEFVMTNFTDANLMGSSFILANCDSTIFAKANLSGVSFADAYLFKADLSKANCREANFERSDPYSVKADDADFSDTNFDHAYMVGSRFRGANFTRANLKKANLSSADFEDAVLDDACLVGAKILSTTNFKNASLKGTVFVSLDDLLEDGVSLPEAKERVKR